MASNTNKLKKLTLWSLILLFAMPVIAAVASMSTSNGPAQIQDSMLAFLVFSIYAVPFLIPATIGLAVGAFLQTKQKTTVSLTLFIISILASIAGIAFLGFGIVSGLVYPQY